MKQIRYLAMLLALAAPGANAAQSAGTAEEARERLRAFGQVCRAGQVCPASSAQATGSFAEENWQVVDLLDSQGEQTGKTQVRSRWVSTQIRWPETFASVGFSSGMDASMRFTHLELAEGENSRYGAWTNHWIGLRVGEREQDFRVRQPDDRENLLLLGTGPGHFVRTALEEQAGETLTAQLRYAGRGPLVFQFPLQGMAEALHTIGLIDASVALAAKGQAADREAAQTPAASPLPSIAAGAARSGQQVYDTFCFACHATGVSEAPLFGSLAQWQPHIDEGIDTLVATSLTGINLMPPMGTCMNCTDQEMRDAIQYMIDNAQ